MRKNEVNLLKKMFWMSVMVPMLLSLSLFGANTVRIMPLGDSITHENYRDAKYNAGGIEEIPEQDRSSYRNELWAALQGGGYNVDFVGLIDTGIDVTPAFDFNHQGENGLRDDQMAANVYGYLVSNPADIVLLHIGTNGVIDDNGADDVEATLNKIDQYENDYSTHVKVILARIINCRKDWDNITAGVSDICDAGGITSTKINTFNNNVEAMAATRIANGDDIVIVDMENGAGFAYDATDMIDDLHPNDTGYEKMSNVWYSSLVDNIPTHQWKLEETAAPYIDIYRDANGVCGLLSGVCPTKLTDGIIGSAQSFNGTNAGIDVADDGTFDWGEGDSFTVEFWMKPNNTTGTEVAIGRYKSTGIASWWIGRSGNQVKVSIGSNATMTSTSNIDITGNQWTHVTVVKDVTDDQIRLYINGAEDTNITGLNLDDFKGTAPVNIGWFFNGYYFDGALDEMTVYNGVLGDDQIKQHFDRGVTGITLAITSTPVTSAELNTQYTYDVNSNDPSATYSLTENPGWMGIVESSGVITGTPDTVGNDAATVTATSGSQTVDQSFVVKVRDAASLPVNMEHYWKLDEADPADKTYIDSYNAATDATCKVGCPAQVPGKVDSAQDFSILNSDLNVPDNASFDWAAGDSFTVELWMKPNSTTDLQVAIGRHAGNSGNGSWWIGREGNKVKVSISGGAATIISNTDIDISGNQWIHVAAVKDVANTEIKLYINGVQDNATAITTSKSFIGTTPVNIGWFETKYWFDGALDDIAIFNNALPANEIATHYQNGLAGNGFDNPDVTAPVITITGVDPQEIPVGNAYTELGATATDDVDGDVSANIVIDASAVDINVVESYIVNYEVNDTAGNIGTATRTVNVVDTIAPIITLTGDATINLLLNDTYTEEGATCTDNYDPTCTITTGGDIVDTSIVGNYTVTYNATDASENNAIQLIRTVNVTAGNAPVIALAGANPYTIEVGSTYIDPGATATDIEDGTVAVTNDSASSVNANVVGGYIVTYTAIDSQGNISKATRTVSVVAAPVDDWYRVSSDGNIYFVGESSVELDANSFTITAGADSIVFEQNGSDPKVYIILKINGEVLTGYEGTVKDPTATSAFAPGTNVSVSADRVLLIKAPLTADLTLGGK